MVHCILLFQTFEQGDTCEIGTMEEAMKVAKELQKPLILCFGADDVLKSFKNARPSRKKK